MKKKIAAVLILLIALISFGCADGKEFAAKPVALAKPAPEAPPVPLAQIISGNDVAIAFAGEKYDPLSDDKYLAYVVDAKDRDAEAQAKATAVALQAAVDQAESELTGQSQPAPTVDNQQSSSDSQPSSGDTSGNSSTDGQSGSSQSSDYSIDFPAGWASVETTFTDFALVAAVSPPANGSDQFLENLGVAVQELPLEISSDEYLDMVVLGLDASVQDFQEISRSDFTLGGQSGKKLVLTYTLGGKAMKDAFYEVVKGSWVYVIIGTAEASTYGEYEELFDASAGSFKFAP